MANQPKQAAPPAASTSFDDRCKAIAARNEQAHLEARKARDVRDRAQLVARRKRELELTAEQRAV